jgi:hypothetical protein
MSTREIKDLEKDMRSVKSRLAESQSVIFDIVGATDELYSDKQVIDTSGKRLDLNDSLRSLNAKMKNIADRVFKIERRQQAESANQSTLETLTVLAPKRIFGNLTRSKNQYKIARTLDKDDRTGVGLDKVQDFLDRKKAKLVKLKPILKYPQRWKYLHSLDRTGFLGSNNRAFTGTTSVMFVHQEFVPLKAIARIQVAAFTGSKAQWDAIAIGDRDTYAKLDDLGYMGPIYEAGKAELDLSNAIDLEAFDNGELDCNGPRFDALGSTVVEFLIKIFLVHVIGLAAFADFQNDGVSLEVILRDYTTEDYDSIKEKFKVALKEQSPSTTKVHSRAYIEEGFLVLTNYNLFDYVGVPTAAAFYGPLTDILLSFKDLQSLLEKGEDFNYNPESFKKRSTSFVYSEATEPLPIFDATAFFKTVQNRWEHELTVGHLLPIESKLVEKGVLTLGPSETLEYSGQLRLSSKPWIDSLNAMLPEDKYVYFIDGKTYQLYYNVSGGAGGDVPSAWSDRNAII